MENKFYHGTTPLNNAERYGLRLQLKPENSQNVFKQYLSFEAGIEGLDRIELVLLISGFLFLAYFDNVGSGIIVLCLILLIRFLGFLSEKRKQIAQNKHTASLLSKGQCFLINGRIIKKAGDNKGLKLIFEDKTVIRVLPITSYALKENDFVSIRYLNELESYSQNESTSYEAHKILELRLFNADLTASLDINTNWAYSFIDPYSEVRNRREWEDKLTIISQLKIHK